MKHYIPQVNDYVEWRNVEGWVYFCGDEHISIEIGVKCKNDENIKHCSLHEKYHTLIICYRWDWHELQYVKTRKNKYAETLEDMDVFIRKF